MKNLRALPSTTALLFAAAILLPACASTRAAPVGPAEESTPPAKSDTAAKSDTTATAEPKKEDEGHGVLHTVLMYLPNRVIDVFDVARFGVNVGPGIGVQVKATDPLQVTFMTRTSLGIGLQSLRHSPVVAGAEAAAGVSVVEGSADAGLVWYQSPTDFRVELHPLLAGAHVAVDPVEILDFALGFLLIDIRDDDL